MKKLIYSILSMITVLLAFSVCVYANNDISYSNGTDVYSNGIIEFYSNRDDEDKLYKLNLSDMTEEKVLDEHIISMVHKDNYLYLLVYANENSILLKFDIQDNSASIEMIFDEPVNNIVLRDNVIYYVKEQKIFAYHLLTKDNDALVTKENVDYIYFTEYNTLKYLVNSDNNYDIKIYDFNVKETEKNDVSFFSMRSENEISLMSASSYSPRLSAPSTTNSYYMHTSYGGLNECIHISGGSVLPNCTGYAWGRSYENLGSRPNLSKNNAERWYSHNKDNGYYSYGEKPALGAVACWRKGILGNDPDIEGDDGGHVAVVEVIDGDVIITSESGYGGSRWFKTTRSASDSNFSKASPYVFQGFIYVCGTNSTPEEPEITEPPTNVSISASSNFISTGQSVTFKFSQSGATYWYIDIERNDSREHVELVTGKNTYTYTFHNEGKYKVWMKAANNSGWTNEYVTITVSNSKPYNVSITPDTSHISTNNSVYFDLTVENAAFWYFIVEKDGVRETSELVTGKYNYSYTFKEEGEYIVFLETGNVNGWTNTSTKITVSDYPTDVSITASRNFICAGQSITFDFTCKNAAYWYIDIERDGSREHLELVTGKNTYTYTFQNEGKYKVWIKSATNDKWTNKYVTVTVSNSRPRNISITTEELYVSTEVPVKFDFTVENAAFWYFIVEKDGVRETSELVTGKYNYSYTFKEEGEYTVLLETGNVNGWTNARTSITVAKKPQKPHLIDINTYYPDGNETIFNWKKTGATTHYNLYIHKMDKFGEYKYHEDIFYAESGITRILEPGKYRVFVQATNSKHYTDDGSNWLYTNSDYVYFKVLDENEKFISTIVKKNGTIHTIETTLHNFVAPYDILIVGYKGNQFVTMKRVPHNEQNSPYTLEGDIDKIKVMVWSDLSTLKPLCEAEEITSEKFIIE